MVYHQAVIALIIISEEKLVAKVPENKLPEALAEPVELPEATLVTAIITVIKTAHAHVAQNLVADVRNRETFFNQEKIVAGVMNAEARLAALAHQAGATTATTATGVIPLAAVAVVEAELQPLAAQVHRAAAEVIIADQAVAVEV